ncbi:hypothetical protein PR048_020028 [Dryococelus australis]|uniref:Integrase catalytic domain-containing protein n=1 Tax=Dryococelus australis TaxID=614101 RepID=A0ABQ9H547_9NEOP|nr:hypothetical protein PR048_020028 [Dryococelus australis]
MRGNSGEGSQTLFLNNGRKPSTLQKCKFCGFSHEYGCCPAANKQCRKCKGMNHFEVVCKKSAAAVNAVSNVGCIEGRCYDDQCSWYVPFFTEKQSVTAKIDSGAQTNVSSLITVGSLSPTPKIFPSQKLLVIYGNTQTLKPVGKVLLETWCNNICLLVNFEVVAGDVECIVGLKSSVQLEIRLIVSAPVLYHYVQNTPLEIQMDSSQNGIGSILALTDAEQLYSQIEKELLACVFAVEKFHHFTYDNVVCVKSDHRPLESVVKESLDKVSPRLQHLLLRLLKYNVVISNLLGKEIYIADGLSWAYLTDEEVDLSYTLLTVHSQSNLSNINMSDKRKQQFIKSTQDDKGLCSLKKLISGLTEAEGFLFFEDRLIVPKSLVPAMLNLIHECHFGDTKQSNEHVIAYFGWAWVHTSIIFLGPVMFVFPCHEPLLCYPLSARPWERVGCDLFQFGSHHYLICHNDFANLIEVSSVDNSSSSSVTGKLKFIFAWLGVPDVLMSDNIPFGSYEFANFSKEWNFKLVLTSPRHSQSNGLAETWCCNTLIAEVGLSSAQIMMGRTMKSKLPCVAWYYDKSVVALDLLRAGEVVYFKMNFNDSRAERRSGIVV